MATIADSGAVAEHAVPLDALLAGAALRPVRRYRPDRSTARFVAALVRRPAATGRRLAGLAQEFGRATAGTSSLAPSRRDRRFTDPAWAENPVLRRLVQAYLAAGRTARELVADAGLDGRDDARVRSLVDDLLDAAAPSNVPLVNPASAKAAVDTAGLSLVRGAANFVRDMAVPPRIPSMVDGSGFEVGRTVAATPGAVVLRTEVFELIQYRPQTTAVREVPLLVVPPAVNRYYVVDLAPGRSLVEHLVRSGQQVLAMSWRNPGPEHAGWGLDTYVRAVLEALDATERICGTSRAVLFGTCAGGTIASLATGYLAATGALDRLAGLTLAVTVLDHATTTPDRTLADAAIAASRRRGYLDGRTLTEVLARLRPADLVWNGWVNDYLLGRRPPAHDVLFWNADTVRVPAALHADLLDLALGGTLTRPGLATACGVPVDLSAADIDAYLVAGIAGDQPPWQSCYRAARLLGGVTRFVLSTGGPLAALVNPPGTATTGYHTNDHIPADANAWLAGAQTHRESWWPDFDAWLAAHGGDTRPAPGDPGGGGLDPLVDAPGAYVLER